MKKPTILKIAILFLLFLQCDIVMSQNLKTFDREYNAQLKGDILVIGNNILNRRETNRFGQVTASPNSDYDGTGLNGNFDMRYINIDNGATPGIFSSSSANLTVPNNRAPGTPCYRVAYAALYWAATLNGTNRNNIEKVKFKVPNTSNSNYQDITGTIIHDITTRAGGINPDNTQAYACFADVTNLLSATNPNGTYTVANVISSEGSNGGTGLSAGWSLFIVYEDSSLPTKAISTFNGFTARQQGGGPNNTVITGFTTIPTGPVQARFAFAALEGDLGYTGDYLQINGTTITPPTRPRVGNANNFFNSTINSLGSIYLDRTPKSRNTLGFDTGVIDIDPSSNVIKNNDTQATITLGTTTDVFIYYFTAFSVDIIAPKIVLTKGVKDINNVDASNKNVTLGEELRYELKFKNEGNDNAKSFTITDQLPINTDFNFPSDIMQLPPGMTIPTTAAGNSYVQYNPTTRTITFTIPNSYVTAVPTRSPEYTIRFKVKVVDDCSKLTDACSNLIQNTARTTYVGDLGGSNTNYGDSSYSSTTGCNIVPQSTNFLVGLDACKNRRTEICTSSMTISASGGYKSYSWSTNSSGSPVIGTSQTLTVTQPGTYYVYNTANPPCVDLQEIITVVDGGGVRSNPIITYADNRNPDGTITGCPIDGKPLPKIYLCGSNDSRSINLNLSGATIVWEKTTCARPTDLSELCADERTSCTWVSAGPNGSLFTANEAGYYRVTINVNGCQNRYYFNVYKTEVSITETHKNIICYNKGNITAQLLTGYEYSLTNVGANTTTNWQNSNVFDIWQAGTYVINYRLRNVPNTCVYKSGRIEILSLTMDPKVENPNEQPNCYGDNGSITVSATAGFSNYYFALYDGANLIQQVGPITANVYTFTPAPGKYYTVEVYTMNGNTKECSGSTGKYINNPASEINVTANAITPLTACSEGKYKITASGGSGGYSFFVDGSTTPQASSENDNTDQNAIIILTPTARDYVIRVRDSKLCEKTITVKVASLPAPVYTVSHTNSNCYDGSSEIRINLTNANGYTMAYSINDGGTYQASPIFSNLSPGNYKVKVKYSITYPITNWPNSATQDCFGPTENVTITGPSAALTASAGVAALAGCTLPDGSGVNQGGKLRINNAQGGTPAYQYSFDGGATWQTSNEKNVLPGTYILVIKDALGCTYTIPYNIILDPRPSDPTIKVEDPVFNCNGTATSTVTVTNGTSSNYSYEYYLDGVANTPISNNVFTNVPSGNHTVSVKYNVTTVSTYSNLLQEDFGKGGYTTTPGINPAYCFEDESTPHPVGYPCGDFNDYQINDGKYAVASSIKTNFGNSWIFAKDHTLPAHPLGRFLCVNVGGSAGIGGILYSKPIKDVIVNQPVIISLWAENLIVKTSTTHADPKLTIQLVNNLNGVGGPETIVATTDTSNPWVVPKTEKWEYKELSLNPGAYNNLSFVIRSYSNEFNGNDVLIDDIWVRQIPESCIAQKNFPIVIDSNKAFSASITGFKDLTCVGSNNGEVTIAAENFNLPYGFDYSLDNGATWINSKVSPVTATGLTSKTYNIQVRFDNSTSSCVFPLTQVIKAPTAITPSAAVTKQATCTTGATITAGATGGTPAYQFQLMNGATIVAAFQTSTIFTNIPTGTYTVVVRDSNSCLSTASTSVTVVAPTPPTATLAATSDLCYDTTNQATLVVTATGTGTLSYSLDGAPAQNSNTFTNVGPGTHNIVVTDSNNCTATVSNIVIAPQLGGEAKITSELNCTTTPNASITVTITGGTSAYSYKVRKGAGTYGSSTAVTGNSFVYTGANTADTYYFEITDSKGCVVVVSAIVNAIVNPTVTAQKVDATCNGASTGSVQLSGAGGAGNYTYLFYSSSTTPVPTTFVTQSNYTGLAAGSYSYQVMDDKGCKSAVGTIVITQPTTLTATASATTFTCDASNVKQAATVTIAVPTTGTAPYQYSFDGGTTFSSTRTLSVTDNGTNQTISYVVSDAQGCKTPVQTITINRLNPPTDLSFSAAAVTCNAATTTVTATATNGVAPLTFAITSPIGSAATNTTGVFAGLAPGVYNFRVTDANGCYYNEAFTINSAAPIVVTPNKVSDVLCRGGNTGSGTYTVSGVATAGAYTYTITPNTGTVSKSGNVLTLTNAAAGTYTVQVTDSSTGCTSSADITFTQPAAALTVSSAVASNVSCNNDNSQITVTASGGTPNYTYAFAKNPSTVPSSPYDGSNILTVDTNSGADLVWDVYVKDANGCTVKSTVTVIVDAMPQITAVTVNNQCTASGNTFTITAAATGLVPLTYSIDGTNFQPSSTFTVGAGSYTVSVKDKNGCIASAPAATVVYPQLTTGAQVTKELDCT
ncbi:beta strand repeat-containing protein, partial [Flavobacterium sp. 22659]